MENTLTSKPKKLEYISFLRVFGMICILLCHYVQEVPNLLIQSTSQIFNIGVQIFFIISGFCFGLQGEIKSPRKWYFKRLKRIYIPYWIFLILYLCVFLFLGKRIDFISWGAYALGIQGNYFKIPGIGQTWFITPLLLCYLITPLLSSVSAKLKESALSIKIITASAAVVFYILICFNPYDNLFVIASPLVFYASAYIWGRNYKKVRPEKKVFLIALTVVIAAFGIRFASRLLFDDTVLYNRFICSATHYAASFGIFRIFEFLFFNARSNKLISKIDSVSFEVYLCHYLFLRGAVILTDFTPNIIVNLIIITIITFVISYIIHILSSFVQNKINQ